MLLQKVLPHTNPDLGQSRRHRGCHWTVRQIFLLGKAREGVAPAGGGFLRPRQFLDYLAIVLT